MAIRARHRAAGAGGSSTSIGASVGTTASPAPGAARAIRIAGHTVPPGRNQVLRLELSGRSDADALPVWVAVGTRSGPRVTVVGAPRGFEVLAARVAAGLCATVDATAVNGGIIVAPVLRPGGRFSARGQPISDNAAWRFPGDPGGGRRAREAFAVFSELALGSSLLVILTAPERGWSSALTVRGDFDDPRVRRLGLHAGAVVALHAKPAPGSLAAAARERGAVVIELIASSESADELTAGVSLMAATRGILASVGVVDLAAPAASAPRALPTVREKTVVRAPVGGLLEQMAVAGQTVARGALLARIVQPLGGRAVDVPAPHDSVVLEAGTRTGVRARASLFLLGRVTAAVTRRGRLKPGPNQMSNQTPNQIAAASAGGNAGPVRVGWVESVSLPNLGVKRLRAKIDTGARTSALHVTHMETVGTTDGPHRRPILELTLPSGSRRGARPIAVRVLVRDYVQVKDTSGRTERRPVIETVLRLGTVERRIRVTLTNRGDMRFPMLIGRTALGPGVVVDPIHRLLLPAEPKPKLKPRAKVDGKLTEYRDRRS